jgi:predicted Rossmann fold nucleotide-binding protein DprA/Smf involved in DNA uptake
MGTDFIPVHRPSIKELAVATWKIMINMNNTIAILALRNIKGVGSVAIKKLWQQDVFDGRNYYEIIENASKILKKNISDHEQEVNVEFAKNTIALNAEDDIKLIDLSNDKYPSQLKITKGPPSIIFYKGNIERVRKTVGIIGTREPNSKSLEIAKRIGQHFTEHGYSICNGLALGIDEACIKNEFSIHSNVVGVVAGGLNYNKTKTLLKSTAQMAEQVLENGGLVMSEYTCNTKEDTFKVVDSCELQAWMSHGLILIQSKASGGSKYTLKAFAELNRPLGIINLPEMEMDPTFEANTMLLKNTRIALSEITGLKSDKVLIEKCISISQKGDYMVFENALKNSINKTIRYWYI